MEEFEDNNFFNFLQNNFRNVYEEAQKNRCTVCLPCNKSLPGSPSFNLSFVEHHILKPSPFFKGEFYTISLGKEETVQIEDAVISTRHGFEKQIDAKILAEEIGYNKNYESYKIYLIDKPLLPVYVDQTISDKEEDTMRFLKERLTCRECNDFLQSFPECHTVLKDLTQVLHNFKDTYYVVQGYLDDAAEKLQPTYAQYAKEFLEKANCKHKNDSRFINNVNKCIESYILELVYLKLQPVICSQCKEEQRKFTTKLNSLTEDKAVKHLSLNPDFHCDLNSCVKLLGEIDLMTTPLEILSCLNRTLDEISVAVTAHINSRYVYNDADKPYVTSDEIIPLLILVIIQCKPRHLLSQMYYAEHFHWSTSIHDNLSFSLVSFRAAIQYINSTDFGTKESQNKTQKHCQSDVSKQEEAEPLPVIEPISETPRGKQFERQLERTTKMLQNSSILGAHSTEASFPSPSALEQNKHSRKKKQQLGSFLSSLADDSSATSFGKQSFDGFR